VTGFQGFPSAALDFYDDLEIDNTKSFWEAHKAVYADSVKAPMVALTEALAPEFGAAKIFRPYRDVRFAKDKTPYKTHQGAYVAIAPATGWYVEVGAPGVRVGSGFYHAEGPDLARIRDSIADERTGTDRTNSEGRWEIVIVKPNVNDFYAKVEPREIGAGQCRGDRSPVFHHDPF